MRKQTKRTTTPKDKALTGGPMPPLTTREVETGWGGGGPERGWAIVSDDPRRPLTEEQALRILTALTALSELGVEV
jgi:hypothetical protein